MDFFFKIFPENWIISNLPPLSCSPEVYSMKQSLQSASVLANHVWQAKHHVRKLLHISQRYSDHTNYICTWMWKEKSSTDRHSDLCFLMLSGLEIEESVSEHLYPTFTNEILFSAICFLLMYSMSHKLYNQKKHCVIQSVFLIELALWLLWINFCLS